ncbi:MAG: CsgG/HfaB family protein [Syntrophobacteraceae bacterium]
MSEKGPRFILTLLLVWTVAVGSAWGGQVVTQEAKDWAKDSLKGESGLKTVPAQNTVAVLYFINQTGKSDVDPLQKGFALMLMTDLSKVKGLQVVERVRLQALLDEMKLGTSGLAEPGTAPRMGRLLRARWLVGGSIGAGNPAAIKIQGDVLDVAPQKSLGQPGSRGLLEDIFRMEKEVLFETIAILQVKPTPEEEKALREPLTTSIEALLLMVRGLEQSDRGNYQEAYELYQTCLKSDPNFNLPKLAISELEGLGLVQVRGTGGKSAGKRARDFRKSLKGGTSITDEVTAQEPTRRTQQPGVVNVPRNVTP